uniref:Uncharacterized protein n=1 Tax=Octopus bimaculoides TaxID=37653 RepID=A0A0L8HWD4_OCTBM
MRITTGKNVSKNVKEKHIQINEASSTLTISVSHNNKNTFIFHRCMNEFRGFEGVQNISRSLVLIVNSYYYFKNTQVVFVKLKFGNGKKSNYN